MATNDQLSKIAAILATLTEIHLESGIANVINPVPASSVYMALGMNMMEYTSLLSIMSVNGLVQQTSTTIRLTLKGLAIGENILAEMALNQGQNTPSEGVNH